MHVELYKDKTIEVKNPKLMQFTFLKQSQDHQTDLDNVDIKQCFNHVKYERSFFNGVQGKQVLVGFCCSNFCCFFKRGMSNISLEQVREGGGGVVVAYSWST